MKDFEAKGDIVHFKWHLLAILRPVQKSILILSHKFNFKLNWEHLVSFCTLSWLGTVCGYSAGCLSKPILFSTMHGICQYSNQFITEMKIFQLSIFMQNNSGIFLQYFIHTYKIQGTLTSEMPPLAQKITEVFYWLWIMEWMITFILVH